MSEGSTYDGFQQYTNTNTSTQPESEYASGIKFIKGLLFNAQLAGFRQDLWTPIHDSQTSELFANDSVKTIFFFVNENQRDVLHVEKDFPKYPSSIYQVIYSSILYLYVPMLIYK